jgi:hypothetical protein
MESCTFVDFVQTLKPWLDRDYIRKGYLRKSGVFTLYFTDGGQRVYHIDDCSKSHLQKVFEMMAERGIPIEKGD